MSTELITFSLTDYTSLRALELEYNKLTDENAAIRSKLSALEELYRKEIYAYQHTREEWSKKEKKAAVSKLEIEKELSQLIEHICEIESQLVKIDKMGINLGLEEMNTSTQRIGLTQSQKANKKLEFIKKCLIELLAQNNHQAVQYEKEISMLKQDARTCRQSEKQLKEQLMFLQEQLSKMQRTATHLQNQLSQTKREYVDYKLKFYDEPSIVAQNQDKKQQMLEDNNFALDLLNFEKELLEKIFNKLLSSLQNESLTEALGDIYGCYESICELFRQKLQIEYDLEDLQRQYKKEKNSKISENLLIELRKQIQEFRNELSKQKQTLAKQEETLEQTFLELKIVQKDHKRLKTYSLQIENKIKDIQHHNQNKHAQQRQEQENPSIKFKPTQTTEELMKEVVRKDKQNLQKIFRQTRMGFLKKTSDE